MNFGPEGVGVWTADEPYTAGHAAEADDAAEAPRRHSGSQCCDEEERRPEVAGVHLVEYGRIELCRRAEGRDPGVVDQDADVASLALHVGWVAEAGSDESGLAAVGGDLLDRLRAARGLAAVDQGLGPVPGQSQGDRSTRLVIKCGVEVCGGWLR